MIGINVVTMKVIITGLAATTAAIGGGFLVTAQTTATPQQFAALLGVIWLAVLVSIGIRSAIAALVAGIMFTVLPQIFASYMPTSWSQIPIIMFGLGAIGVAKFPDGTVEQNGESFRRLLLKVAMKRQGKNVEALEASALGGAK
jgi:branched-chain amino acid transport system permease protein